MDLNNLSPKEKLRIQKKHEARLELQHFRNNINPAKHFTNTRDKYRADAEKNMGYIIGPNMYNRKAAWQHVGYQFNNMTTARKVFYYIIIGVVLVMIAWGMIASF